MTSDRAIALRLLSGWLKAIRQQNKAIRRKNKLIKRLRGDIKAQGTLAMQQTNWRLVHENCRLRTKLELMRYQKRAT